MTVGVSHTFGSNVVVVDMEAGTRWDLTPLMASAGAKQCLQAAGYMTSSALVVIECLDDRKFRFAGSHADMLKMADDLFEHAKAARAKVMGKSHNPEDEGPRAA